MIYLCIIIIIIILRMREAGRKPPISYLIEIEVDNRAL